MGDLNPQIKETEIQQFLAQKMGINEADLNQLFGVLKIGPDVTKRLLKDHPFGIIERPHSKPADDRVRWTSVCQCIFCGSWHSYAVGQSAWDDFAHRPHLGGCTLEIFKQFVGTIVEGNKNVRTT